MTLVSYDTNSMPVYDTTVHIAESKNVVWRTTSLLNGDHAVTLLGRATRIWEVHKVLDSAADPEQSGVLKDSWMDADRSREGRIVKEIKTSPTFSEEDRALLLPFFAYYPCRGGCIHRRYARQYPEPDGIWQGATPTGLCKPLHPHQRPDTDI